MGIFDKLRSLFGGQSRPEKGTSATSVISSDGSSTSASTPSQKNASSSNDNQPLGGPSKQALAMAIAQWTISQPFYTYYRDSEANEEVLAYLRSKPQILKVDTDMIVSRLQAKPSKPLHYIIYSSHIFNDYEVNGEENYDVLNSRVCTIPRDAFFLTLDIYETEGVTVVILLHIPYQAVEFIKANGVPEPLQNLIRMNGFAPVGRKNAQHCLQLPYTLDKYALQRMTRPIGFDEHNQPLALDYTYDVNTLASGRDKHAVMIRRFAIDLYPINYPEKDADKILALAKANPPEYLGGNMANNLKIDFAEQFKSLFRKLPLNQNPQKLASLDKEFRYHFLELDPAKCKEFLHASTMDKWNELLSSTTLHFGDNMTGCVDFIKMKMQQLG